MSNAKNKDVELEKLIIQTNEILKEIRDEQHNTKAIIEQNHKVNMKKFSKLLEYNEINDMINQVFEKRICSIEKLLYDVFKG